MSYIRMVQEFLESNKATMGDIEVVVTSTGEEIPIKHMDENQAKRAAETLFIVGNPTRLGALVKGRGK